MSELVPPDEIESIVGAPRHPTEHYARAVSEDETVYILHSQECKDSGVDLRKCPFSRALDKGIDRPLPWSGWRYVIDRPVRVEVFQGFLVPELASVNAARRGRL